MSYEIFCEMFWRKYQFEIKIKIIDELEVLVWKLLENQIDFCFLKKEIRVGEEKVMELKCVEKEVREKVRVVNEDVEKGEGGIEVL